jgi:hypothetical protein
LSSLSSLQDKKLEVLFHLFLAREERWLDVAPMDENRMKGIF